jgi:hypothetical protein
LRRCFRVKLLSAPVEPPDECIFRNFLLFFIRAARRTFFVSHDVPAAAIASDRRAEVR